MGRCRLKRNSTMFVLVVLLFNAYTVSAGSDVLGQSAAFPKSASDITEVQKTLNLKEGGRLRKICSLPLAQEVSQDRSNAITLLFGKRFLKFIESQSLF